MRAITIVGGGVAGLALGIGLRREGIPAVIHEAGDYPRHRVCGEFVNGAGVDVLARWGLLERFYASGAREARTVQFCTPDTETPVRRLPRPGICLSRYRMESLLAEEYVRGGGELRTASRWRGPCPAGVVRATGKRRSGRPDRARWLGLKAHAVGGELKADLELHWVRGGYVGLCRVGPNDELNVCGLFDRSASRNGLAGDWPWWLSGEPDSPLRRRLQGAAFAPESFCSTAGFSLEPVRARDRVECSIGDSLSMIPPLAGNGMSMAFEAAHRAMEPLRGYARGERSWAAAASAAAKRCDAAFSRRLFWSKWLHWLAFRYADRLTPMLIGGIGRFEPLWRGIFAATR